MGGFLGIGGVNSRQQNTAISGLNKIFDFGLTSGKAGVGTGTSALGAADSYFKNILSGNRTATQAAVAPATNQVRSAADAQKRQQATMGTARGGGVAGQNQQRDTATQAAIDNAIFAARPAAAAGEATVGGEELNAALSQLGLASNAMASGGQIATGARSQSQAGQQALIGDIFGFGSGFKTGQL